MKHRIRLPRVFASFLFLLIGGTLSAFASLPPQHSNLNWDEGFGLPGTNREIHAMEWADGILYAAGDFSAIAGSYVNHIARWDGARWAPLGTEFVNGVDGLVRAIAVDGDNVYVGGDFKGAAGQLARNIAVWNKSTNTWSSLGGGVGGFTASTVNAIAVHDGSLYVAGRFLAAGSVVAANIARWDGTRWHRVGAGVNNDISALHIEGDYLYVAGDFTIAGSTRTRSIARYNLQTGVWEDAGAVITGTVASITSDDQYLYIGGAFIQLNGIEVNNIARMNKNTGEWSGLDRGLSGDVHTMRIRGNQLLVGGKMNGIVGRTFPRGYEVRRIAMWNGTEWSTFERRSALSGTFHPACGVVKVTRFEGGDGSWGRADGSATVNALAVDNSGSVYIGGWFDIVGPMYVVPPLVPDAFVVRPDPETAYASNLCKLSGNDTAWRPLGGGLDDDVRALADDGTYLYVGGSFRNVSEYRVNHIARINKETSAWETLGVGTNDRVNALAVDGDKIYVGGVFDRAGGLPVDGVASWNSTTKTWAAVGDPDFQGLADLIVVDGDLYGCGTDLFHWNGSAWNTVPGSSDGYLTTLLHDGDFLYVGGRFQSAGGAPANNVARLNLLTGEWTALGTGLDSTVNDLVMWNGTLCAGGLFTGHVASWDPSTQSWSTVGSGVKGDVYALSTGRFGLYAAGTFLFAQSASSANSVALWNEEAWLSLGTGVQDVLGSGDVFALLSDDDALYLGGNFLLAGGKTSYFMAKWHYPPPSQIHSAAVPVTGDADLNLMSASVYPNPASDRATFRLSLPQASTVSAELCNAYGESLRVVVRGEFSAGMHQLPIDIDGLASGAWFLRVKTEHETITRSFVIER